ncbi:MAG: GNAT family N-acetyltransferase [Erysipelotrichaceae bacterium]|nr:GNAT family N-acetyltransferase [Erysipelotrichaceae bacterium]MBQ7888676.1 GNAT family N-acetyltransferase [Erysipelotrichaceae bacterium]
MKVKIANTQSDFFQIVRIRAEVFIREQNVDSEIEMDEKDDTAIHCLATFNNQPAGCLRILLHDNEAIVGRVAVLKKYRRHHIGKAMMNYVETLPEVQKRGKITVHAQLTAKDFYLHCGFHEISDIYLEAGIQHVSMEKNLA